MTLNLFYDLLIWLNVYYYYDDDDYLNHQHHYLLNHLMMMVNDDVLYERDVIKYIVLVDLYVNDFVDYDVVDYFVRMYN